jgi:hypothetical protein
MKIFAITAACLLACSVATAGGMSTTLTVPTTNTQQQSADASASNAGNNQSIVVEASQPLARQEIVSSGTTTLKNVPSVSGPPLTTSNDTCMGSTSGSANGPGFGVSVGTTWSDGNCKLLKNARELWNMGMKAAALALLCTDDDNRKALEVTDYQCPQSKKAEVVAATANEQYTDPIVRNRLGLPPLK